LKRTCEDMAEELQNAQADLEYSKEIRKKEKPTIDILENQVSELEAKIQQLNNGQAKMQYEMRDLKSRLSELITMKIRPSESQIIEFREKIRSRKVLLVKDTDGFLNALNSLRMTILQEQQHIDYLNASFDNTIARELTTEKISKDLPRLMLVRFLCCWL
jgi:hypothetical protein